MVLLRLLRARMMVNINIHGAAEGHRFQIVLTEDERAPLRTARRSTSSLAGISPKSDSTMTAASWRSI